MLDGKKTYIVGAALVIYAVLGFLLHKIGGTEAVHILLDGAGLLGIRHAIEKGLDV